MTLRNNDISCIYIYDKKAPKEKHEKQQERKHKKLKAEKKIEEIKEALALYEEHGVVRDILTNIMFKRTNKSLRKILHSDQNYVVKQIIEDEIRAQENQSINITWDEIDASKELLSILGVCFMDSHDEAETMCSHLCVAGQVDAVLSNDTDVLAYGTPKFLTNLDIFQKTCIEIDYEMMLESISMDKAMFTDFCIMCGTDYNSNIYRIGHTKAYRFITTLGSIEELKRNKPDLDISVLNHERVREIFKVPDNVTQVNLIPREVDKDKLKEFSIKNHFRDLGDYNHIGCSSYNPRGNFHKNRHKLL